MIHLKKEKQEKGLNIRNHQVARKFGLLKDILNVLTVNEIDTATNLDELFRAYSVVILETVSWLSVFEVAVVICGPLLPSAYLASVIFLFV